MIKKTQGFTLIELMLVVAIIGILSSIAIPAYQNYVARAQVMETITLASKFRLEINEFYSQAGVCPQLGQLNLASSTDVRGKYTVSLDVAVPVAGQICAVQLTLGTTNIASGLQGKHLIMSMTSYGTDLGAVNWSCTSNIEQRYLPKTCQGI